MVMWLVCVGEGGGILRLASFQSSPSPFLTLTCVQINAREKLEEREREWNCAHLWSPWLWFDKNSIIRLAFGSSKHKVYTAWVSGTKYDAPEAGLIIEFLSNHSQGGHGSMQFHSGSLSFLPHAIIHMHVRVRNGDGEPQNEAIVR